MVKVFIVEDEFIHLENLKLVLEEAEYELIGSCMDADAAFALIKEARPDVVLVDIALPGLNNGITLAKKINEELNIPHIFTTSFSNDEVIQQAVATNPAGYLKKPVELTNLKATIALALKKVTETSRQKNSEESKSITFTKIGDRLVKIPVEQIEYIKADGDNFISVFFNNKQVACRTTLKDFMQQLPGCFIQVHRSAIININFIEEINEKEQVAKIGAAQISIGRKYKKQLLSRLNKI